MIPTYNEADTLPELIPALEQELPAAHRILVVDDDSPDGTAAVVNRLSETHNNLRLLPRSAKEGLGPAYIDGFRVALDAGAATIVQMDADYSHDPGYIPEMLGKIADGDADVVIGSRYVEGGGIGDWGSRRKALSRWGSRYARFILGLDLEDLTGGFKCWRREALEGIDFETVASQGYSFQVEMNYRAVRSGFRVVEIPIIFRDRRVGESKMSRAIVLEAALRVPLMRLRRTRKRRLR